MSHNQSDPRLVVRIAIALTALKHRPRDQSIASYLLDLQSHFPVATKHEGTRDWRTYALELEKQVTALKAQRDADQASDASTALTSDAPPPKKKSKKNPAEDQHDLEWSWDQSRADWTRFLSSQYPSSLSLVAAYTSLRGALVAPDADPPSRASRLADAILRTLDTTHHFLFSCPNQVYTQNTLCAPLQLQPEHIDSTRIALASPLIMYTLRTALHALVRTILDGTKSKRPRPRPHITIDAHARIDRVLDRLLECVLLPLLRAIVPLCSSHLTPLVSTPPKKDKDKVGRTVGKSKDKDKNKGAGTVSLDPPRKTDVRTDVFALIGASLEALDVLPPLISPPGPGLTRSSDNISIATGIRDRLGLETIRELEALYALPERSHISCARQPQPAAATPRSTPTAPTPSQPQPQPQSRVGVHTQHLGRAPESRAKRLERCVGTRAERVRALATRDAGWFLASTLHLCVAPLPPTYGQHRGGSTGPSGDLLRGALLDRVGKLVRSINLEGTLSDGTYTSHQLGNSKVPSDDPAIPDCSRFTMDPVCQNMLLAICERALGHLVSS